MLDSITAVMGTQSLEYKERPARPPGVFAQVLNHVEWTTLHDPPTRNILQYTNVPVRFSGIPSVFQLIATATTKPVTMTRELQEWAFELMLETAPPLLTKEDVKKVYANAYMGSKAFTNGTGHDTTAGDGGGLVYADWVLGTGLDNPTGWKLQHTICHGATVKVLRTFQKAGITQAAIECLNANDPTITNKTYKDNPWLIFPAINWARYPLPLGQADPFPKNGDKDVPIPLITYANEAYIDASWLRYLTPDEPFPANPYWRQQ